MAKTRLQCSRNAATFRIVCTGPIVTGEGMVPYRIVLRRQPGGEGFITHEQSVVGRSHNLHGGFVGGHYFPNSNHASPQFAFAAAWADFTVRVANQIAGVSPDHVLDG